MNAEKEMLRYVRGSIIVLIIVLPMVGAIFSAMIYGLFGFVGEASSQNSLLGVLLAVLIGVFVLRHWLRNVMPYFSYLYFWNTIKSLKSRGMYHKAALDFNEAVPVLNDRIRLGRQYLFCKNTFIIIAYSDIHNVHQYVEYTNHFETSRELRIVDKQNQTRMLCKLKGRGNADIELHKVIRFMLHQNPNITVGYNQH